MGKNCWEQAVLHRYVHIVLDRIQIILMNTFTFPVTCVQTQFKGSSTEIEQQVKQHEARTLNKLSNVKARLKRSVVFFVCFCLFLFCFF